ncbi:hypothetical protein M0R72_17445 [Candidatus Pacearchaeota archaeon]|nr:hypothetical protein [Candidatus Pacearchaeota archaeon]
MEIPLLYWRQVMFHDRRNRARIANDPMAQKVVLQIEATVNPLTNQGKIDVKSNMNLHPYAVIHLLSSAIGQMAAQGAQAQSMIVGQQSERQAENGGTESGSQDRRDADRTGDAGNTDPGSDSTASGN